MHRSALDKGDKPTVSMDYKAFCESEHDDDKIQMVVVKDESTGCVSAHVCEAKGAGYRWVVDRICDDIGLWGHTELIIKGDGEPALIQCLRTRLHTIHKQTERLNVQFRRSWE